MMCFHDNTNNITLLLLFPTKEEIIRFRLSGKIPALCKQNVLYRPERRSRNGVEMGKEENKFRKYRKKTKKPSYR